jgi:hypothetical protein
MTWWAFVSFWFGGNASYFWCFWKKADALMFFITVDSSAPRHSKGDYSPQLHWTLAHELGGGCASLCFKVFHSSMNWWCGTKFLIPVHDEPKKCHPHLRLSKRWRLAFLDSAIFLCLWLGECGPILSSWAIIASWPSWPFHFFTGISLVDEIGMESGLVY